MSAEELLKKLLEGFFVESCGHLEWSYVEGTTLAHMYGNDFERELIPYLDEEKRAEYQLYQNSEEV